jgi:hypothetical protein
MIVTSTKTPEQMAEEYLRYESESNYWAKHAFLAGYKAAQEWISVEDRLPGIGEWVMVDGPAIVRRIDPPNSNWKKGYAWETDHDSYYDPDHFTHWMPLPDKPQEEK